MAERGLRRVFGGFVRVLRLNAAGSLWRQNSVSQMRRLHWARSADANITPKTVAKWVERFRAEGVDGLRDRSSRPLSRGPKSAPVEGRHELFGFLTTEANAIVAPIHPKAMPVILTTPEECDTWLESDIGDALALQRPLPDDALRIVASGEKEDGVAS